ncbi:MAG: FUSC family protein [Acidothermaceae bacterium]
MSAVTGATEPTSSWRRLVDDVLRFDRSAIDVADAIRMAVGTIIPLIIGVLAGSWASGAAAAGGALAVGISSVVPSPRPRVAVFVSVAFGMAFGTFVGSASSSHPALHVAVGAAMAFVCGLLVAVEPRYATTGINTLVAFLVYGRFSAPPPIAARTAGLVAAGAVLQLVLVVLLRRRPRVGRALTGLSLAYQALADFAAALQVDRYSLAAAQAFDAATTDREFSFRADTASEAWTSLAGEGRRVRIELLGIASSRSSFEKSDDEKLTLLDQLGDTTAHYLRRVAESLASAEVLPGVDDLLDHVEQVIARLGDASKGGLGVVASHEDINYAAVRSTTAAHALAGQLRAIAALLPAAIDERRAGPIGVAAARAAPRVSRRGLHGAEIVQQQMRANLTPRSDAFRHAVRLAVVVTIATALAHAIDLGRGYWLVLTAVLVLRPEFSITFTRGVARAVGTLIGVGLATIAAVLFHPHGWALVPFVAVFVWLSGMLFNASYAVYSIAITGVVVFLLAGLDTHPVTDGLDRLFATAIGSALALLSYVAFPTWGRRPASAAIAELAAATHRYVVLVLHSYIDSPPPTSDSLSSQGRAVRLARTNTEAALARSLADPTRRRLDAQLNAEILAALRRLAIAAHTLRLRRPAESKPWVPAFRGDLGELVEALDIELNGVSARLQFGRIAHHHEALRDRHRALIEAVTRRVVPAKVGELDPTTALILAETDEMVDAVNSLNAVLDQRAESAFASA